MSNAAKSSASCSASSPLGPMQPVRWLSMYPISSELANSVSVAGGLDDGDALVAEDEVAELMGQRAVPCGQPLLDQEHVPVGVLPPLAAYAGWQIRHLELDGPIAVLADGADEAGQRYFTASRGKIEHSA